MCKVNNIDDVIKYHTSFLDSCLRDCIVTSNSFLDIHKILSVCLLFSAFIQGITKDSKGKDEIAKFDSKYSSKSDLEKRKQALQVKRKMKK